MNQLIKVALNARNARESALLKIKRLAGTDSTNKPSQVAEVLLKMQSDMHVLQVDAPEDDLVVLNSPHAPGGRGTPPWTISLAKFVAHIFHAHSTHVATQTTHYFEFLGQPGACELSVFVYELLLRQVRLARQKYLVPVRDLRSRRARGDQFVLGWISAVATIVGENSQICMEEDLAYKIEDEVERLYPYEDPKTPPRYPELASTDDFYSGNSVGREARMPRIRMGRPEPQTIQEIQLELEFA